MTVSSSQEKFFPKKRLGQNFLVNRSVQERIVQACELHSDEVVLEIGPGQGALTKLIAPKVKELIAVEKDRQLIDYLRRIIKEDNVKIIHADILEFPLEKIIPPTKMIGNLPYNIATPILERMIHCRRSIPALYITVQKEYAKRLAAGPGSKDYGSLSCFIQYYADVKVLFDIARGVFRPVPKVRSSFVRCLFHKTPAVVATDENFLFALIRKAFQQRRKTLENALSALIAKELFREIAGTVGIDPKARAEEIPLNKFVGLANELDRRGITFGRPSL